MKVSKYRLLTGVAVVASIMVIGVIFITFVMTFGSKDRIYDRTSVWPNYYREVVSHYFRLPDEAAIQKAIHVESAIMGMHFIVEFKLPSNQLPEDWLKTIAERSNIKPSYRKTPYLFDCGKECDLFKLQYIPEQHMYIATAGWD